MIDSIAFGADQSGAPVRLWRLRNGAGAGACISELGAALVSLEAPDRDGRLRNVALGFDSAEAYTADRNYIGVVVGRYANRIAGGAFEIDGKRYRAPCNENGNLLHGGEHGFHRRVWRATPETAADEAPSLRLELTSPHGESGFPGEVRVSARYRFTDAFELIVRFEAHASAPTPLNLTQHAYWNLAGADAASILDHALRIAAARYTPVRGDMIPTGALAPVAETPFDFRQPMRIGDGLVMRHPQLSIARGYDHNWVLDGAGFRPVAWLSEPESGRRLTLHTDQPGLQLYSFNTPQPGSTHAANSALALEPQAFPDAPNQPDFPSAILRPGETYRATIAFAFGVQQRAPCPGEL